MRRAVFLDRDGVLNRSIIRDGLPKSPQSLAATSLYPEVPAACARLRRARFLLICVTNQPDIAHGRITEAGVEVINRFIDQRLRLDDIRVCPHDDDDGCRCRKPKPGMLTDAARDHEIDLAASFMVGDRWRDADAGRATGCATVFIDRDYREPKPDADFICHGLGEAAEWILAQNAGDEG